MRTLCALILCGLVFLGTAALAAPPEEPKTPDRVRATPQSRGSDMKERRAWKAALPLMHLSEDEKKEAARIMRAWSAAEDARRIMEQMRAWSAAEDERRSKAWRGLPGISRIGALLVIVGCFIHSLFDGYSSTAMRVTLGMLALVAAIHSMIMPI